MSRKSVALRKRERMQIKLSTLLEYYLTTKKVKGCSNKTIIAIRSVMERFIRFQEGRGHSLKLADLKIEDARLYVASLQGKVTKYDGHKFNRPIPDSEYSPQTIHSHLRILRTFSNWVKDEGYSTKPIFERLELPRLPQVKIAVLSPEEIQQVLASINPGIIGARLMAMVLVMLDTGIRAGELVGMLLTNVDWARGVIKVYGKGSKERFVPIGSTAKQTMFRYEQTFRPKPARDDIDNVFLSVDGWISVDGECTGPYHASAGEEQRDRETSRAPLASYLGSSVASQWRRHQITTDVPGTCDDRNDQTLRAVDHRTYDGSTSQILTCGFAGGDLPTILKRQGDSPFFRREIVSFVCYEKKLD